jgi:hypothetical protein
MTDVTKKPMSYVDVAIAKMDGMRALTKMASKLTRVGAASIDLKRIERNSIMNSSRLRGKND